MEQVPPDEVVEVDDQRFILLTHERVWPRYVVTWSLRQREGEGDFPVTGGSVEELPSSEEAPDGVWSRLRDRAMAEAKPTGAQPAPEAPRKGFLARLLGR